MSMPLIHLRDINKRPKLFTVWERYRHSNALHWAIECFAEAMGVFFYVYFGLGSQVSWVFTNLADEPGLSSILQVGLGYAFGIVMAISVCAGTSGGHFNPCVTICMVIFKGFSKLKAVRYIVAQIFGAFLACLVVYAQWKSLLDLTEAGLIKAGLYKTVMFTPNGPAGAFANYLLPHQTIGRAFMNEFVSCFMIGMVIWACLDPANVMVPPQMATFVIAFSYAASIWGFAVPGVSLNAARDIGGRLAAMAIWGLDAKGTSFAAISALVNIPATVLAVIVYEIFLVDSDRVIDAVHLEFGRVHAGHLRTGHPTTGNHSNNSTTYGESSSVEKSGVDGMIEHANINRTSHV